MTEKTHTQQPAEPSKSQRKREAQAQFKLGRTLAELAPAVLDDLPLDPELRAAIDQARAFRSRGARKRQLGFVARLLRQRDVTALVEALAARDNTARADAARFHRVEAWRDGLLAHGDAWLAVLLERRPEADAQSLRQLVRNAARQAAAGKPPAAARKLFRALAELDRAHSLPPVPEEPG